MAGCRVRRDCTGDGSGSSLLIGIAGLLGWGHWLIGIETALIGLFAFFWIFQTHELWGEGLRWSD